MINATPVSQKWNPIRNVAFMRTSSIPVQGETSQTQNINSNLVMILN